MKQLFEEEAEKDNLSERVSSACYEKYNLLSSRGKPLLKEWTHLAAFVSAEKEERGTFGCLLHDSHAEVIARRSLTRFFYEEMINENNSILIKEDKNKFRLNKSIRLYFFVSYPPCGATAYLSDPIKRPKFSHKSLNSSREELYLKPGKGSATTSLSCTNKINRWIEQGLEGFLLNQLIISPIKLSGLIIIDDKDLSSGFQNISVLSGTNRSEYGPSSERIRPPSMSIAWWEGLHVSSSVVTVDGYLYGQIRRLKNKHEYANPIAKSSLFRLHLKLMSHLPFQTTTYGQAKNLSSNSLRNQFMLNNPQGIKTDPDIFYSFTLTTP